MAVPSTSPNSLGQSVAALTIVVGILIEELTKAKVMDPESFKAKLDGLEKEIRSRADSSDAPISILKVLRAQINE